MSLQNFVRIKILLHAEYMEIIMIQNGLVIARSLVFKYSQQISAISHVKVKYVLEYGVRYRLKTLCHTCYI